jgi:hypothetical protein
MNISSLHKKIAMTTVELKKKLINKINQIDDDEIQTDAYMLLVNSSDEAEIYRLSDDHKIAVEEAMIQISKGEFLTGTQADSEIAEWLNK